MLDTNTKKRIDDCRDILVGKLPDPKAQIEQITIGLIYKFMDDMDKEAIELGGKAKFFSGTFEKYSWDALFNTKVTAAEMLKLYSEAIESMEKNPNIPQLFRDIFNSAYLPYRDPETLKLFLKTIGEFEYTHSEKLGDAFEYLLSVMGSQGDAGQFRTPRHIIDFIVAVIDPGKKDTILDPACGTAGFLISAFKHIKAKAEGEEEGGPEAKAEGHPEQSQSHPELVSGSHEIPKQVRNDMIQVQNDTQQFRNDMKQVRNSAKGKGLTPDESKRLIQNFVGYDISPDMVRLSLVNLYLHGFSDPHIVEYDTLTSEERWNDNYDVILANPPFMSPKGGIRPHKKFTVSSNRSEVLFVDYIAEHLNPKGRAGIIVPEGVIFQSGTAYKELRKMLVENYLYAVVSLPAGVFNPYSGVKTSILLMDKELAKTSNEILFVKIDNDGFGLGAQRNAVKGGQLETAIEHINAFRNSHSEQPQRHLEQLQRHPGQPQSHPELVSGSHEIPKQVRNDVNQVRNDVNQVRNDVNQVRNDTKQVLQNSLAHAVSKTKIAKNGDYNLSGERYKITILGQTEFELFELEDLFEIKRGGSPRPIEDFITDDINGINWIKIGDVQEGAKYITSTKQKIKPAGLKKSRLVEPGDFILSNSMSFGRPYIVNITGAIHDGWLVFKQLKNNLNKDYIFNILSSQYVKDQFLQSATGGVVKNLNIELVKKVKIPLPPLSIQEEIVAEIEGYQKIIDGAKMVVETYKPKIDIDPEWEMVELGDILRFVSSGSTPKGGSEIYTNDGVLFIRSQNILSGFYDFSDCVYIPEEIHSEMKRSKVEYNDVFLNITGASIGRSAVMDLKIEANVNQHVALLRCNDSILPLFLSLFLNSENGQQQIYGMQAGASREALNYSQIKQIKIPLPILENQREILSQIEKEQELVNANKQLIEIFEQKIKDRIAKVWGD